MVPRLSLLFAWLTVAGTAWSDPRVTNREVPPPGPKVARLWFEAAFQAPLLQWCDDESIVKSQAARMYLTVLSDAKLGSGVGWYDPSRRRHDFSWLTARFDADHDGRISLREFGDSKESFARLDRNRNGFIAADDFDWSNRSEWVKQDAEAFRILRAIDGDGDGRLHEDEWLAYFKKVAGTKGFATHEDLRDGWGERPNKGKKVSREVWLRCLIEGDLGSPFEGPAVNRLAPDFTLSTVDGKQQVTLSEFRAKKPVALIFGSFT